VKLSFATLTLLEWAGDQAAATILRAWSAEAGWLLDPPHLQIHYHSHTERFTLHTTGGREIISPTQWCSKWEKRSLTPLPIEAYRYQDSSKQYYKSDLLDYEYPDVNQ
jgi:hypothetical protein